MVLTISADFANTTSYNTLIHCHTCALGTPLSLHHHTHLHLHTFIRVQGLYTSLYFVTQVFMRVPTMPPKKKANSQPDQGPVALQNTLSSEGTDPMSMAIAVIDKKARNLEKRKVWSSQSVRLSVCLSALGQECLWRSDDSVQSYCTSWWVLPIVVRTNIWQGKIQSTTRNNVCIKILANACMQCWLYVHPCVMGANWTTKTAWLVYGL